MRFYRYLNLVVGLATLGLILSSCAHTSKPGEPEYIREQVYMCRELCAGGDVSITKIEGLDCVCNKPDRQNLIFSPIINNNVGGSSTPHIPIPSQVITEKASIPSKTTITPNGTGATITDASGREITSQVKEED